MSAGRLPRPVLSIDGQETISELISACEASVLCCLFLCSGAIISAADTNSMQGFGGSLAGGNRSKATPRLRSGSASIRLSIQCEMHLGGQKSTWASRSGYGPGDPEQIYFILMSFAMKCSIDNVYSARLVPPMAEELEGGHLLLVTTHHLAVEQLGPHLEVVHRHETNPDEHRTFGFACVENATLSINPRTAAFR